MPEPFYETIQNLLVERGWTLVPTLGRHPKTGRAFVPLYEDPDGNRYADIGQAVIAECYRDIAPNSPEEKS